MFKDFDFSSEGETSYYSCSDYISDSGESDYEYDTSLSDDETDSNNNGKTKFVNLYITLLTDVSDALKPILARNLSLTDAIYISGIDSEIDFLINKLLRLGRNIIDYGEDCDKLTTSDVDDIIDVVSRSNAVIEQH